MKRLFLPLLAALMLPTLAFADGRELATKNFPREFEALAAGSVASGDYVPVYDASTRKVKKLDATSLPLGGTYDVSSQAFGTALTANPLMKMSVGVVTLAQANAGQTILASVSGKTIYPGAGLTIMASGSAAGATGVYLRCRGSNNVIMSVPIVMLTDGVPVGPFKSSGAAGTATPVLASALTRGCAANDAIYISTTGTLTTTTHLYYSLPYTVQ